MIFEFVKFIIYSILIVVISKYILVYTLRKLAENLNLNAKTVGEVAGYATSVPEFLTITTSSLIGLTGASIYNIFSSNVINLIQYLGTIILNKNIMQLKNKAIKVELFLVLITIIIPIVLLKFNVEMNIFLVPIFIIMYFFFRFINNNVHKLYLQKVDKNLEKEIEKEKKWEVGNKKKTIKYLFILIVAGIFLFIIGELLGNTLENLCNIFNISQIIIGILLGFITSIPELITFFESQKHYQKTEDNESGVVEATNNLLISNMLNLFVIQTIGIVIVYII